MRQLAGTMRFAIFDGADECRSGFAIGRPKRADTRLDALETARDIEIRVSNRIFCPATTNVRRVTSEGRNQNPRRIQPANFRAKITNAQPTLI